MIAYLLGVAALTAWLVLPGLAIGALAERRSDRPSRLRFAMFATAGGLSVWTFGSELLVRAGGLHAGIVWLVTLLIGAAAIVVLRTNPSAVFSQAERRGLLASAAAVAGSVAVAGGAIIWAIVRRRDALNGPTPWYYWSLTRQTIAAGGVPVSSMEWATRLPFLDDYPGFTGASAALAVASLSPDRLVAAQLVRVVVVVAFALACFILARQLGSDRFGAAVATILAPCGAIFAFKLSSFRPEAAGYALMLLIPALAIDWFRSRRISSLVLASVAGLTLSQLHGLDWVFAMASVGGVAVAAIVTATPRRVPVRLAISLGLGLLGTWIVGNQLLGGGLSGATKLDGLPRLSGDMDPTFEFKNLVVGRVSADDPPALGRMLLQSLRQGALGLSWNRWMFLGLLALAALAWTAAKSGERRRAALRLLIIVAVSMTLILGFSFWLASQYSTFVPRRTGLSRVLQLIYIYFPFVIAIVITAMARRRRLVGFVVGVVITVGLFVTAMGPMSKIQSSVPPADTLGALRALDLPPKSLVLTNYYSEGFVPDLLDVPGALDGRAPYTERRTLARVNAMLRRSIQFFSTPAPYQIEDLPVQGLTHVLVATGGPYALGARTHFPTDLGALALRGDLKLVVRGPGFLLYEVVPS